MSRWEFWNLDYKSRAVPACDAAFDAIAVRGHQRDLQQYQDWVFMTLGFCL